MPSISSRICQSSKPDAPFGQIVAETIERDLSDQTQTRLLKTIRSHPETPFDGPSRSLSWSASLAGCSGIRRPRSCRRQDSPIGRPFSQERLQMLGQERDSLLAPEAVLTGENFVAGAFGGAEDLVDLLHTGEAFAAGIDGEDAVFVP